MNPTLEAIPALSGAAPILGHLREVRRDWLGLLERLRAECGDVGRFRLGPSHGLVFNDPELAAAVLIDHSKVFEKGPILKRYASIFMGDGLITCDQALHSTERKRVAAAFTPKKIEQQAEMMRSVADTYANQRLHHGQTLDLHALTLDLGMDVINTALFSQHLSRADAADLRDALDSALGYIVHRINNPLYPPLQVPTAANRAATAARRTFDRVIGELIDRRRHAPHPGPDDVLQTLLDQHTPHTPARDAQLLRDHMVTLMLAGFETSASVLTWTFALLANDPDVAAAVYETIDALPDDDDPKAPLLHQTLLEAMRLYPPGHTLGRRANAKVKIGPYTIDPGTVIIVSPYLLHRRPESFPDPTRFDPHRFAPPAERDLPRGAYIPFGAGARVCLGGHFALLEARIALRALLSRWRFVPLTPGLPRPLTLMTLRPESLMVRVEARP